MLNDLLPGAALSGHIIRAILAHPHAVAIASDVEGEPVIFIFQGKTCTAQAKGLTHLLPGHLLPADGDGRNRPRLEVSGLANHLDASSSRETSPSFLAIVLN